MAWKNDLSAALVVPGDSTKACMQAALSMNNLSSNTSASLSGAMLQEMRENPGNLTSADIARFSSVISQTAKELNVSTERTTFLSIGALYLCQYQANGMSAAAVERVAKHLISEAAAISTDDKEQTVGKSLD